MICTDFSTSPGNSIAGLRFVVREILSPDIDPYGRLKVLILQELGSGVKSSSCLFRNFVTERSV